MKHSSASFKPPTPPHSSPLLDEDVVYEQLSQQIKSEIKRLQSIAPQWFKLSDQRPVLVAIEKQYVSLLDRHVQILSRIRQIEAEIDCATLYQMLHPFDVFIARLHDCLKQSWQLIDLNDSLDAHDQWLESCLTQTLILNEALPPIFSMSRFESLLEDSDHLSDLVTHFGAEAELKQKLNYKLHLLNNKISHMQDLLDQVEDDSPSN